MARSSYGRDGLVFNLSLDGAETPPLRELRHSTRRTLAHLDEECAEDAELLVTELVSNAYDHGHPPVGFRLCLVPDSPVLRIEVEDGDRANLPQLGASRLGGERGRGLVLVDQLSLDWGFNVTTTGKVVWVDLSCRGSSLVGS
ncbi:ATP-binding protein [Lentzea jiangxiensis]|uniref:ATP-binding protein n=1 Tax=Lentzea jiangxiensis TaxID=641025 RepID=UPI003CCBD148